MNKKIFFTKMNGAGNDFIIIDQSKNSNINLTSNLISHLCDRRMGIGADGLMTITKSEQHDFEVEYYNSDGKRGSICGNGGRCIIKYAFDNNFTTDKKACFLYHKEVYSGFTMDNGEVTFNLAEPTDYKPNIIVDYNENALPFHFIDTGSPHAVLFVDEIKHLDVFQGNERSIFSLDVVSFGSYLRHHPYFSPNGTNVNFVELIDDKIYIRTFERGVEEETFACGTGATASGIILHLIKNLNTPVELITKSRQVLTIDFIVNLNKIEQVSLRGPAEVNFEGYIELPKQ